MTNRLNSYDSLMTAVRDGRCSLISDTRIIADIQPRNSKHLMTLTNTITGKLLTPAFEITWSNYYHAGLLHTPVVVRAGDVDDTIYYLLIPNYTPDGELVNTHAIGITRDSLHEIFDRPPAFCGEVVTLIHST